MSDTATLYQSLIMDRSKNPRHAGKPAEFLSHAHGDNPMCGDRTEIFVTDSGIRHETRGCAIVTASADLMAEAAAGKSPAEFSDLRSRFESVVTTGQPDAALGDLNALSGVFEFRSRIRCATLPWSALSDALESQKNHE